MSEFENAVRWSLFASAVVLASLRLCAAEGLEFPDPNWEAVGAASSGWDGAQLRRAQAFSQQIHSAAVFVVVGGRVVASWGAVEKPINLHSIRKSLISALYGIHSADGKIDLQSTLGSLGIDDSPPKLTEAEKRARVEDLLMSRSGVYHPANYETDSEKERRPARGSHPPGSFWYYNNWDFNALGTILSLKTGRTVFESFQHDIATPLHMQDFRVSDGKFEDDGVSIHPAYLFRISARDLARFGLLYLANGQWKGRPIVPGDWVGRSTRPLSSAGHGQGYGYLWWTPLHTDQIYGASVGETAFAGLGHGGHVLLVSPKRRLVFVHLAGAQAVPYEQVGQLAQMVLAASKGTDPP